MQCKYCGSSISNLSNICPNCGRLISYEQQIIKKDINGINDPYINKLNELNKKEYINQNIKNNSFKGIVLIIIVILIIIIMAIIMYNR